MRKKFMALLATVVLCIVAALPVLAAKPALQAYVTFSMNSVGGVSPTIYYRNNTGKTMKYIDWYMTPYNAVNDKVKSEVGHYLYGEVTGPIAPFSTKLEKYGSYRVVLNNDYYYVNTDSYGCPYIYNGGQTYYLTNADIDKTVLNEEAYFECMWYNWSIDHIVITKAVITYMDGIKQTVSGSSLLMTNNGVTLQNASYEEMQKKYADVYNYKEYRAYNLDLDDTFGADEHRYLEHFISSGMKEGRRGNYEFNLADYKANNPDLIAVFGDDNAKYYEHYISSGKAEGRLALPVAPEFEITDWKLVWDGKPSYNHGYVNFEINYRNNTARTIEKVEIKLKRNSSYYAETIEVEESIVPQATGHSESTKLFYASEEDLVEVTSVKVTYMDGLTETIPAARATGDNTKKSILNE